MYLYSCLSNTVVFKIFWDIPDDVFYELLNCSKTDFLTMIDDRHNKIICMPKIYKIMESINKAFSSKLNDGDKEK